MHMAFVDSYSFSHRFTDNNTGKDVVSYQKIIYQCSGVNATGPTRQFLQFAVGCGYAPQSIVEAFSSLADEYGSAYCYSDKKTMDE